MSDEEVIKTVKRAAMTCMNLWIDSPPGGGAIMLARYYHALQVEPHEELMEQINHRYEAMRLGAVPWTHGVPFRAPHFTASRDALVGTLRRMGELELAAGGVLVLDEVAQFRPSVLREVGACLQKMDPSPILIATTYMSGDARRIQEALRQTFVMVRLDEPLSEATLTKLWSTICEVRP